MGLIVCSALYFSPMALALALALALAMALAMANINFKSSSYNTGLQWPVIIR
jgi:hypothetical protein